MLRRLGLLILSVFLASAGVVFTLGVFAALGRADRAPLHFALAICFVVIACSCAAMSMQSAAEAIEQCDGCDGCDMPTPAHELTHYGITYRDTGESEKARYCRGCVVMVNSGQWAHAIAAVVVKVSR